MRTMPYSSCQACARGIAGTAHVLLLPLDRYMCTLTGVRTYITVATCHHVQNHASSSNTPNISTGATAARPMPAAAQLPRDTDSQGNVAHVCTRRPKVHTAHAAPATSHSSPATPQTTDSRLPTAPNAPPKNFTSGSTYVRTRRTHPLITHFSVYVAHPAGIDALAHRAGAPLRASLGPGLGHLSRALLGRGHHLLAVHRQLLLAVHVDAGVGLGHVAAAVAQQALEQRQVARVDGLA